MIRLPAERVKQAILHPDAEARDRAVSYFSEAYSTDPEVMPLAIQAVEKYGRGEGYVYRLRNLAQTEATIDWVVQELKRREGAGNYRNHLDWLLLDADPRLLLPREADVLQVAGFDAKEERRFRERLSLLEWDAEQCWAELERCSDVYKDVMCSAEFDMAHVSNVIEALARKGEPLTERILSTLAQDVEEFEGNPRGWLEIFLAELVGEMRLKPAVGLLVKKLHIDGESLLETCSTALAKIGTEEAAQALAEEFPQAEDYFRLYAASTLGHIRADRAVRACLDLLPGEKDWSTRTNLGASLLENFAFEGVEVVRQMVLKGSYDEMMTNLEDEMVAACKVMDVRFPEMDAWEAKARRQREEIRRREAAWSVPRPSVPPPPPRKQPPAPPLFRPAPPPPTTKVGRNDPCPCGSGKKFKNCCLRKD